MSNYFDKEHYVFPQLYNTFNMYLNIPSITCYLNTSSISTLTHFPNPKLCVYPRNKQTKLLKKNIYIKTIKIITQKVQNTSINLESVNNKYTLTSIPNL